MAPSEFVIKDLAVSFATERGFGAGSTFMPVDGESLPWWISPVAGVLNEGHILEAATRVIVESLEDNTKLESVLLAFEGGYDGNALLQKAIHEVGSAVVAAAAFSKVAGAAGMPNPDCGGTSYETIPPTFTPVVHQGFELHRISDLPRLRRQLAVAVEALDVQAERLAPQGKDVEVLRSRLERTQKALG